MAEVARQIVQSYLDSTGLSLTKFGEQFGVGHPTIINWRDGNSMPDTLLMLKFSDYSDWRGAFAREILAAKLKTH